MTNLLYRKNMPELDLHGEIRDRARVLVKEFVNDNYKMRNYEIAIVHGIGTGILKKEVHKVLKENKLVQEFGLDNFNSGCTLVRLIESVDKKAKKCYNTRHNSKGDRV